MFRALLKKLEQILTLFVATEKMHRVDNQNQRSTNSFSPSQGNLLHLVESAFDIEKSVGVAGTTDGEERADVVFVEFKVQCLSETDSKDFGVGVGFEHSDTLTLNLRHGVDEHAGLSSALLANK